MPEYLVTGGAGFIGAALCRRLLADGAKVSTIDNLSTGFRENIPNGVEFLEGDCADKELLTRLSGRSFDAIVHIAGQSSGELSFQDPEYDLRSNALSTLHLLALAEQISCRRFLYASSMSVYGALEQLPATEASATLPCSFYGVSKLSAEHYLRIFAEQGISSLAFRLFNVYGPGQNLDNLKQGMVSIFLAQALREKAILVRGSAERFRDFVFIDDVVEAFHAALHADIVGFEPLNICSGVRTTVAELLEGLGKLLPEEVPVKYEGSTAGDVRGCVGQGLRAEEVLAWQAQTSLREGLEKMVSAYF